MQIKNGVRASISQIINIKRVRFANYMFILSHRIALKEIETSRNGDLKIWKERLENVRGELLRLKQLVRVYLIYAFIGYLLLYIVLIPFKTTTQFCFDVFSTIKI